MLATLLPGFRQLRAPLAAGYVWLFAAWLAAPAIRSTAALRGVTADLRALYDFLGTGPSLAALSFAAYLLGALSIRMTDALIALANWITITPARVAAQILRRILGRTPALPPRFLSAAEALIWALTPGGLVRRRRRDALRTAVLVKLVDRYRRDEPFQTEVAQRITDLYRAVAEDGVTVPRRFARTNRDDLVADLADRPDTTVDTLWRLIDVDRHASELTWETSLIVGTATAHTELQQERDRSLAEADFRRAMILPFAALVAALAHRINGWLLLTLAIPVWLLFLSTEVRAEADQIVLTAIAQRTVPWPALDHLDNARIHYRPFTDLPAAI